MKGYDVVTSEGRKIGRVIDTSDGFLVIETGLLRSRRPLPKEFAHAKDEERTVVVTVPKKVLQGAPKAHRNGTFDVDEASKHYGLASSFRRDEPVWAEQTPEHQLAVQHERAAEETGVEEGGAAPLTKQPEGEVERRPERIYLPGGN